MQPEHRRGFAATFPDQPRPDSFADGYAISYHDAVVSAAVAVRLAGQTVRPPQVVPTAVDVDGQFNNTSSASAVRGAPGTLSFLGVPRWNAASRVLTLRLISIYESR